MPQFEVVREDEPEAPSSDRAGAEMLRLALTALSKRFVVALAELTSLLTVASVFALWWTYGRDPSILQIVALGLYALFVLAVNVVAARRK